ncbi:MAG: hypothetical protein ABIJ61_12985 [bacterium]
MQELTLAARIESVLKALPAQFGTWHEYLVAQLGQTATFAIYLALGAIILLALFRSFKFSFDVLRFVVVPTLAIAFVGSLLLPYSFLTIAPFAAIACSTLLFIRG